MKKALPWIIVGAIVIIALIFFFRKRDDGPKKIGAGVYGYSPIDHSAGFGTGGSGSGGSLLAQACGCEKDAGVQELIERYNKTRKTYVLNLLKEACPCVKI